MDKIFKINNVSIEFSNEMDEYNNIRNTFLQLGEQISNEFRDEYNSKYTSIDEVSETGLELGNSYIIKCVDKALGILVSSYELISIDREFFIKNYYKKYMTWQNDFNKVNDKYLSIELEQQQLDEYRTNRRENRDRWYASGTDMQSAIENKLKAEALNMASNAIHGAVNMAGKYISTMEANEQKKNIFEDPENLNILVSSIKYNCFIMHKAVIDALYDNKIESVGKWPSKEDSDKSKALFNNYKSGLINNDKKDEVLKQIIILNPYNKDLYKYIIDEQGDEKYEIEEITSYLGIDINKYKINLLDKYFNSLPVETEEQTLDSKEKIKEYSKHIGIQNIEEYIKKLDEILVMHDRNIRTVDNIEFSTREEASIAKDELNTIMSIINKFGEDKEENILNAIYEINNKVTTIQLKEKYIDKLNNSLKIAIANADKLYLDNKFNISLMSVEKDTIQALEELKNESIRSSDILENKIKEVEQKQSQIIEVNDREYIDSILTKYLFFSINDINTAKEEINLSSIRTQKVKDEKINFLDINGQRLIKDDIKRLEKAIKYEEYLNKPKQSKAINERKGLFGNITRAISSGVDTVKEKIIEDQKESWNYITKNGTMPLETIKSKAGSNI